LRVGEELLFIINCKNYEEIAGEKIVKLAKVVEKISKKYKIKIAIAPPHHQLEKINNRKIILLAQHIDIKKIGSTTGYIIPELLKKSNVHGSIINHSEHRIPLNEIKESVIRLKKLKMISIVCVKNVQEVKKILKLKPDYIAIEPPELIGSGRAISNEKPELITKAAQVIKASKNQTKLLCGAGIISRDDVKKSVELGSKGILVASGIIKVKNWEKIITDFSKAML